VVGLKTTPESLSLSVTVTCELVPIDRFAPTGLDNCTWKVLAPSGMVSLMIGIATVLLPPTPAAQLTVPVSGVMLPWTPKSVPTSAEPSTVV